MGICFGPDNLNKLRKGSKRRIGNYQHIYNTCYSEVRPARGSTPQNATNPSVKI